MTSNGVEIEVKFHVRQLSKLEERLNARGARLVQPRTHELNLRFDTPEGDLTAQRRVLRLRRDQKVWLTYKGPSHPGLTIGMRQEIEFEVSNFDNAKNFLKALGYQIYLLYEKYRQVYALDDVQIMLDELPFGHFVEIEGADEKTIEKAAGIIGLNWEAHSTTSYLGLFDRLKARCGLTAHNLCFNEFQGMQFTPEELGLSLAD